MRNILKHLTAISTIMFLNYSSFALASPLSYTDVGKGKPIVLIHAFPTDQKLWQPQQAGLKHHFRIITLDLKGFGQAEKTNGLAITMTDYASDIKTLLDKLQVKKAVIGGESMGGYVALAFAEKYPQHVNGLILSDTQAIADTQEAKDKREVSALEILEKGTQTFNENFLPKALSSKANSETIIYLKNILDSQSATGMASALRGMALRHDTSLVLKNLNVPVLIITGDQDVVISGKQSQDMHQLARNSKLVIIENAGHLSSLEQSEKWNHAVIDMFYHK